MRLVSALVFCVAGLASSASATAGDPPDPRPPGGVTSKVSGLDAPDPAVEVPPDQQRSTKTPRKKKPKNEPAASGVGDDSGPADDGVSGRTASRKKVRKKSKKGSPVEVPRVSSRDDEDGLQLEVEARASLGEGILTGDGIHRTVDAAPAAMSVLGVAVDPRVSWGPLRLSAPASLEHRETWGAHLNRTDGDAGLQLEWKPIRQFKATVEGGVAASMRPAWFDPYQPVDDLPDNGLLTTDRRSSVGVRGGARVMVIPFSRTFLRARYDFERTTNTTDPAFDPVERPNHLAPRNNDAHVVEASIKGRSGVLAPGLSLGIERREWFFVFSRDAGSGATHAGPGGDPPNPLQILHGAFIEPEAELSLLDEAIILELAWRLRVVDDISSGYYSRLENRLSVGAEVNLGPDEWHLEVKGRFSYLDVLYGPDSYVEGPTHPALDFGDRRLLRRSALSLRARFPVKAVVRAFIDLGVSSQVTNFPDYAPGIFPKTQSYVLDWDYQNAHALLGLEWSIEAGRD